MQPYRTLSHLHAFKTGHYSELIEKDGKNFKIQAQPRNLGNTLHPPGILMDLTKSKACDRTKTASD
jgi:hypothetical protein